MNSDSPEEAGASDSWPAYSLRQCLGHFATGVAVATYETPEYGPRGLTVNSFASVSLDPPLVLFCLDRRSRAIEYLPSARFAVNVLGADQRDLAWHFAGRSGDVQADWRYADGVPLLQNSLAWLTCAPFANHEAGDHLIVVGRVVDYGVQRSDALCFFRGEFVSLAPPEGSSESLARETTV